LRKKTEYLSDEQETPKELKWVEQVTNLMDIAFKVPYTNFRIGLDPIIGLIHGVGEATSFSVSSLMVLSMVRHGASREVIYKMLMNLSLDAVVGVVPILGDIFDATYKANRRNYKLLLEHQTKDKHEGNGWGIVIGVGLILLLMLIGVIVGLVVVWRFIWGLF